METADGKKKIRYIDYFKALLMILVILGHINFANQEIKAWIYAFHMPPFFFASGMLLKNGAVSDLRSVGKAIWKKFQCLMFPYFIWALIYSSLEASNLVRILYGSHQVLGGAGSLTSLWFLPALFLATGLFYAAQLVFKNKWTVPVKLILAAVSFGIAAVLPKIKYGYPWCVNVSFCAFGFILLGNVLFPLIQTIHKRIAGMKAGGLIVLLAVCLAFAGTLLYQLNIPEKGYVNMANAYYGNYFMFLFVAGMGILFSLSLSLLLDRVIPETVCEKWDFLSFLGQNTLCAFVIQKPVIKVFKKVFTMIRVPDVVSLAITCIGTAIVCCIAAMILNRWLPVFVGKLPKTNAADDGKRTCKDGGRA